MGNQAAITDYLGTRLLTWCDLVNGPDDVDPQSLSDNDVAQACPQGTMKWPNYVTGLDEVAQVQHWPDHEAQDRHSSG